MERRTTAEVRDAGAWPDRPCCPRTRFEKSASRRGKYFERFFFFFKPEAHTRVQIKYSRAERPGSTRAISPLGSTIRERSLRTDDDRDDDDENPDRRNGRTRRAKCRSVSGERAISGSLHLHGTRHAVSGCVQGSRHAPSHPPFVVERPMRIIESPSQSHHRCTRCIPLG